MAERKLHNVVMQLESKALLDRELWSLLLRNLGRSAATAADTLTDEEKTEIQSFHEAADLFVDDGTTISGPKMRLAAITDSQGRVTIPSFSTVKLQTVRPNRSRPRNAKQPMMWLARCGQ